MRNFEPGKKHLGERNSRLQRFTYAYLRLLWRYTKST